MESRDPGQTEKDSRDRERIPLAGELHGEIMLFQSMVVREISRGGAQIETTSPLKVDSLHELRVVFGEEPWLARTHGDGWPRYKKQVRRWL